MSDLKIQHLITLTELLSMGAKNNFVSITTSSLGKNIHKSQQAASKHLLELEENGFIKRIMSGRRISVMLTQKGYDQIADIYNMLKTSMESGSPTMCLEGTVTAGMGEGAYYMSLKGYTRQFKAKIGYVPFPGTLNIKIEKKEYLESLRQLSNMLGTKIEGFSDGKRTYGWVRCYPCMLNGKIRCHLILLERTHHDLSIIELISSVEIRKKIGLKNNSRVKIQIRLDATT